MSTDKETGADRQMSDGDARVFDADEALSRADGDRELLSELMEMYLVQTKGDIAEIEAAISRKDTKRLEFVAHSLKGASATLAAELVRVQAYRMEKIGASGNLTEAPTLLRQLKESINITNELVSKALARSRSGTEGRP